MAFPRFAETSTYHQPFQQYGMEAGQSGWLPVWPGLAQSPANSSTSQQLGPDPYQPEPKYSYYVRMFNPKRKSEFIFRMWHAVTHHFNSPAALKLKLMDCFPADVPSTATFQIGYFEPPSNVKRWIVEERDLQTMYSHYDPGSKINLWCEAKAKLEVKETDENDVPPVSKKKISREAVDDEVDTIFQNLREKHPKMEAPKLRLWAKLIQTHRHESYDDPPQIPLITGSTTASKPKRESIGEALTGAAVALAKALQPSTKNSNPPVRATQASDDVMKKISPLKVTVIRRSCLEDLKKLKELFEDGVLTETEFTEEKQHILATLKGIKK